MNNRTYAGEIAHNLSARVKTSIVKRAAELDVKLLNAKSKLKSDEKKKEWFLTLNLLKEVSLTCHTQLISKLLQLSRVRGAGCFLVVSLLAFYSEDPSSNPL